MAYYNFTFMQPCRISAGRNILFYTDDFVKYSKFVFASLTCIYLAIWAQVLLYTDHRYVQRTTYYI